MSVQKSHKYYHFLLNPVGIEELANLLSRPWSDLLIFQSYDGSLPVKERSLVMEAEMALQEVSVHANSKTVWKQCWLETSEVLIKLENLSW